MSGSPTIVKCGLVCQPVTVDQDRFVIAYETPPLDDYLRLRIVAGLSARDPASALAGLPNSCVAVTVRQQGHIVGMGRVIGDGGLVFQIVDIAVDPLVQGEGIGKAIMAALVRQLRTIVPGRAYVSLIADGEAHRLYRQHGFEEVAPAARGMALWVDPIDQTAL
ncbi:MAG: GNAT family N-acetyltransferase [Erythrobacter sp.]